MKLRNLKNRTDLARVLNIEPAILNNWLYADGGISRLYSTFDIPKKTGGSRQICAPNKQLKKVQERIVGLLVSNILESDKDYFKRNM